MNIDDYERAKVILSNIEFAKKNLKTIERFMACQEVTLTSKNNCELRITVCDRDIPEVFKHVKKKNEEYKAQQEKELAAL